MADEKCIALCDFTPQRPDELGFQKGDVITVLAKGKDSGFWEGRIGERRGLFPNCFVSSNMHPGKAPAFTDFALALFAYKPQAESELAFEKHDLISVKRAGPSPGWFYGVNESAYVRQREREPHAPPPTPLLFPSNYVTCNLVKAQYNFVGRQRCELSLKQGDVILVHRRWNDGWWEGSTAGRLPPPQPAAAAAAAGGSSKHLSTSSTNLASATPDGAGGTDTQGRGGFIVGGLHRGIFPSNYTISNVSTLDPPLFCKRCRTVFQPRSTACRECGRNEEILRTMMQTLDDFAEGKLEATKRDEEGRPMLDLFEHIDVDPTKGRGALLNPGDERSASTTVRPRLAV